MLERIGTAKIAASCTVLHSDNTLRLLGVDVPGDEPIRLVDVTCPSTGGEYMLRVPPGMTRCREAVAWTFGVPEAEYQPRLET